MTSRITLNEMEIQEILRWNFISTIGGDFSQNHFTKTASEKLRKALIRQLKQVRKAF